MNAKKNNCLQRLFRIVLSRSRLTRVCCKRIVPIIALAPLSAAGESVKVVTADATGDDYQYKQEHVAFIDGDDDDSFGLSSTLPAGSQTIHLKFEVQLELPDNLPSSRTLVAWVGLGQDAKFWATDGNDAFFGIGLDPENAFVKVKEQPMAETTASFANELSRAAAWVSLEITTPVGFRTSGEGELSYDYTINVDFDEDGQADFTSTGSYMDYRWGLNLWLGLEHWWSGAKDTAGEQPLRVSLNVVPRPLSSNADLSALTASVAGADGAYNVLDIGTFSSSTTSYTATVPYATTHVKLTPTVEDGAATVTVDGTAVSSGSESDAIALSEGNDAITVRVTAEDTTTKDYTVTVTRQARPLSSNADLSALTASVAGADGAYDVLDIGTFSSSTTSYTATVPYATTHVKLTPTVEDGAATVTVDGTAVSSGSESDAIVLSEGNDAITVRVTAEDTTTKDYTVTVTRQARPPVSGDLVNISTRAVVGTGDEVMIGGFIIRNGPKRVLVQAQGPELADRGIANALADPVLTVTKTTDPDNPIEVVVNDNWEDTQGQLVSDFWGGSSPLTVGSLSAAAVLTLDPGNYTAKVEGKDGATGVALVEVYDLDSANAPGDLVNISTRAVVGTGEEVMIGGFIIRNGPKRVLVQAQGPELADRGIANALADPVLTVTKTTDPDNPIEVVVNDNWEDTQGQDVIDAWRGSPNLDAGSLSAAAILTLDPGNYTAKVEGKDGATGVALVEVYAIDSAATNG